MPKTAPYGYCPTCLMPGYSRTRGIPSRDTCEKGHTYLASEALNERERDAARDKKNGLASVTAAPVTFTEAEHYARVNELLDNNSEKHNQVADLRAKNARLIAGIKAALDVGPGGYLPIAGEAALRSALVATADTIADEKQKHIEEFCKSCLVAMRPDLTEVGIRHEMVSFSDHVATWLRDNFGL